MSPLPQGPISIPLQIMQPRPTHGVTGRYEFKAKKHEIRTPTKTIVFYLDFNITVKVDLEGKHPQNVISIIIDKPFESNPEWDFRRTQGIAKVISDTGFQQTTLFGQRKRVITAQIDYRFGVESFGLDQEVLPKGSLIKFTASVSMIPFYQFYQIEFDPVFGNPTYPLTFVSDNFDQFTIEVDQVVDAGAPVVEYDLASHPNRPASLPVEKLTLASVFEAAGFDTKVIQSPGVIPLTDAKTDAVWSDAELHNAMVKHSSIYRNAPQLAMWLLFARRHMYGPNWGGIMFDDRGLQRQGAAVFTDSFLKDVPAAEAHPEAYRNRMLFTAAIHEIGHCFNMYDSSAKSMSSSDGEGNSTGPWQPLQNDPLSRSFMTYPWTVTGGADRFFSDFRFRFSDLEMLFMRHAPRQFVEMGGWNFGGRHGMVQDSDLSVDLPLALELRPNRSRGVYQFLEPIVMELKLTNRGNNPIDIDPLEVQSEDRVHFLIQRDGGSARRWAPFATRLIKETTASLAPGESLYGSHAISLSPAGWLLDEPGFYRIQGAISINGIVLYSNPQRVLITPPTNTEEAHVALDWFNPDVARVLAFQGCPALSRAEGVLTELRARCPNHPASIHAGVSLQTPLLREFKHLGQAGPSDDLTMHVKSPQSDAATAQRHTLFAEARQAARTLGHIRYVDLARDLAESVRESGDLEGAVGILEQTVGVMRERKIAAAVIDRTLKLIQEWQEGG